MNDLDCMLANFWRAVQHDPDGVAYHADSPVNECDLHARHRWLVGELPALREKATADPDFYDAKIAGCWCWGICLWIGSGWCESGKLTGWSKQFNQHGVHSGVHRKSLEAPSEHQKRPKLYDHGGGGVHRKRFIGPGHGQGAGVHSLGAQGLEHGQRRWQGGGQGGGSGVHAPRLSQQIPEMEHTRGLIASDGLYAYMQQLAARLRRVRVCCGDWKRVLTPSVTTYIGTCGVFLDPPYSQDLRQRCYAEDHDISREVREWAITHGDDPDMRIALCGYDGEHQMPDSWECVPWKSHGGYSRTARGVANRARERIWFNGSCLKPDLFSSVGLHCSEIFGANS